MKVSSRSRISRLILNRIKHCVFSERSSRVRSAIPPVDLSNGMQKRIITLAGLWSLALTLPMAYSLQYNVTPLSSVVERDGSTPSCVLVAVQGSFQRIWSRLDIIFHSVSNHRGFALSVVVYFPPEDLSNQQAVRRWFQSRSGMSSFCVTLVSGNSSFHFPINLLRNLAAGSSCGRGRSSVLHLDADFILFGNLDASLLCGSSSKPPVFWVVPALEPREAAAFSASTDARPLLQNGSWVGFRSQSGYQRAQSRTDIRRWQTDGCSRGQLSYDISWAPNFEPFGFAPAWVPPFDIRFFGSFTSSVHNMMVVILRSGRYYNKMEQLEHMASVDQISFKVLCGMFILHQSHPPSSAWRSTEHRQRMRRLLSSVREERSRALIVSTNFSAFGGCNSRSANGAVAATKWRLSARCAPTPRQNLLIKVFVSNEAVQFFLAEVGLEIHSERTIQREIPFEIEQLCVFPQRKSSLFCSVGITPVLSNETRATVDWLTDPLVQHDSWSSTAAVIVILLAPIWVSCARRRIRLARRTASSSDPHVQ